MSKEKVILRFENIDFEYLYKKPVLEEASFSIRSGSKITLMGQNGAGKSTIFKLITEEIKPKNGKVHKEQDLKIGTAKQVMEKDNLDLSVEEYLKKSYLGEVPHNAPGKIKSVMEAVNLEVPADKKIRELSGGQQARLLLAYALIQEPDILLLDEPTNNLDDTGIDHLIQFLIMYEKTVLVISHDADFLNCFTDGVIYLDVFTHHTEQYDGNYYDVVEEISRRIERERRENARLEKEIKDRKEKANFFSHKGGKLRKIAQRMRDEIEKAEENKIEVRREDKEIREFIIPCQEISGSIAEIKSVSVFKNYEELESPVDIVLRKGDHLLLKGPNGIGKSSFLKKLVSGQAAGVQISPGIRIGYYSQDFSGLDPEKTVYDSLYEAMLEGMDAQEMRRTAAGFQLFGDQMGKKISELSEGQKGLLSFAQLTLSQPSLLILDEPSNHINFRHIPVIAKAINDYEGAVIVVSHMRDFTNQIKFNLEIDLGKI